MFEITYSCRLRFVNRNRQSSSEIPLFVCPRVCYKGEKDILTGPALHHTDTLPDRFMLTTLMTTCIPQYWPEFNIQSHTSVYRCFELILYWLLVAAAQSWSQVRVGNRAPRLVCLSDLPALDERKNKVSASLIDSKAARCVQSCVQPPGPRGLAALPDRSPFHLSFLLRTVSLSLCFSRVRCCWLLSTDFLRIRGSPFYSVLFI